MFSESFIGLVFDVTLSGQRSWDPQLQERDAGLTTRRGRQEMPWRDLWWLEQIGVMFILRMLEQSLKDTVGTPYFMAPEASRHCFNLFPASLLVAVGCLYLARYMSSHSRHFVWQVVKNKGSDFRSDTWSLGCLVTWHLHILNTTMTHYNVQWPKSPYVILCHTFTSLYRLYITEIFQVLTGLLPFYGGRGPQGVKMIAGCFAVEMVSFLRWTAIGQYAESTRRFAAWTARNTSQPADICLKLRDGQTMSSHTAKSWT